MQWLHHRFLRVSFAQRSFWGFSRGYAAASSVHQLTRFIDYARYGTPYKNKPPTACSLKGLYTDASNKSQLNSFAASQLSTLLVFFGHLALSRPRPCEALFQDERMIEIAASMRTKDHKDFWNMVIRVGNDMRSLNMPLLAPDHSFLLRAYVHIISANNEETLTTDDPRVYWAAEARHHYIQVQHLEVWELHCAYFSCMLEMPSEYHRHSDLHQHLCNALTTFPILSDRFFNVLLNIVMRHYHVITEQDRDQILSALRTRCTAFFRTKWKEVALSLKAAPSWIGVNPVMGMFRDHFIGRRAGTQRSHAWVSRQLSAALSVHKPANWQNFMFFANYFAQDERTQRAALSFPQDSPSSFTPSTSLFPSDTNVPTHLMNIFFLAEVERTLSDPDPTAKVPVQSIWHLVRPVWEQWTHGLNDPAPLVVERAVLSTFFRLCHHTYDRPFFDSLFHYSHSKDLFVVHSEEPDQVLMKSQVVQLTADFGVALYLHDGGRAYYSWTALFERLQSALPTPLSRGGQFRVGSAMVDGLARVGMAQEALDLYQHLVTKSPEKQVPSATIYSLATCLAQRPGLNHVEQAIPFLHKSFRLSHPRLLALLGHICTSISRNGIRHVNHDNAKLLLNVISAQMSTIPEDTRPDFYAQILLALPSLIRSHFPQGATRTIQSIQAKDPLLLTRTTLISLVDAFLEVKQWKCAVATGQLALGCCQSGHLSREMYHDVHRVLLFGLCRRNVEGLPSEVYHSLPSDIKRTPMEAMVHAVDFRINRIAGRKLRLSKEQTATVLSLFRENSHVLGVVKTAMLIMANAGKLGWAEEMMRVAFRRIKDLDALEKSHLCTILLHGFLHSGAVMRLKGRTMTNQLRSVVRTLETKYDFRMSRVSLNVILQALLLNRETRRLGSMPSPEVRRLFDYVLMHTPEIRPMLDRRKFKSHKHANGMRTSGIFHTNRRSRTIVSGLGKLPPVTSHDQEIRPMMSTFVKAFERRGDKRGSKVSRATAMTLEILSAHDPSRLEWSDGLGPNSRSRRRRRSG